jgi:hypothetical protein
MQNLLARSVGYGLELRQAIIEKTELFFLLGMKFIFLIRRSISNVAARYLGEPESWEIGRDDSIPVSQTPGSMMDFHRAQSRLRNLVRNRSAICVFAISSVIPASFERCVHRAFVAVLDITLSAAASLSMISALTRKPCRWTIQLGSL